LKAKPTSRKTMPTVTSGEASRSPRVPSPISDSRVEPVTPKMRLIP
jgi:hypothetical protein